MIEILACFGFIAILTLVIVFIASLFGYGADHGSTVEESCDAAWDHLDWEP